MKKIKKYLFVSGIALLLASCSTTNHSYRLSTIPQKNVISGDVVVDTKLDLTKKVEATSSLRNSVEEAKEEAYYKAITQNNIDVIVDPIYEVRTTDRILIFGGKSVAKITGFGANYVNPRTKVEAINELTKVDTANIRKFDAIYLNRYVKSLPLAQQQQKPAQQTTNTNQDGAKSHKSVWGLELGRIASNYIGDSVTGEAVSGFTLGLFKTTESTTKINYQFGITFSSEGNSEAKQTYLRVPFVFKYSLLKKLSIDAGAQLGYNLSSEKFHSADVNSLDYGILYGVSYKIGKSMSLGIRSYMGIAAVSDSYDIKNINSQFVLGYRF